MAKLWLTIPEQRFLIDGGQSLDDALTSVDLGVDNDLDDYYDWEISDNLTNIEYDIELEEEN